MCDNDNECDNASYENICTECAVPGNGECGVCRGSGFQVSNVEGLAKKIGERNIICDTCGGTGDCIYCDGEGIF